MPSPEPTYVFVKGEGWILSTCETLRLTCRGKLVEVQARKPQVGELGCYSWPDSEEYVIDGKPNLDRFARWFNSYTRYGSRKPCTAQYIEKAHSTKNTPVWVTFVYV